MTLHWLKLFDLKWFDSILMPKSLKNDAVQCVQISFSFTWQLLCLVKPQPIPLHKQEENVNLAVQTSWQMMSKIMTFRCMNMLLPTK